MAKNAEILINYLQQMYANTNKANLDIDSLDEEYQQLGRAMVEYNDFIKESYNYSIDIANGRLDVTPPSKNNPYSGPIKDLTSSLKHLNWQFEQVSKGDFTQRVDFLGDFSDYFNEMIDSLKSKELTNEENNRLKDHIIEDQLSRQIAYYNSYTAYTKSLTEFKSHYKTMMGKVYELLNEEKIEDARRQIIDINDEMHRMVNVHKEYSNHSIVNAMVQDCATMSQERRVGFDAKIYIPDTLEFEDMVVYRIIFNISNVINDLVRNNEGNVKITSNVKGEWLIISIMLNCVDIKSIDDDYTIKTSDDIYRPELKSVTELLEKYDCMFDADFSTNDNLDIHLYIPFSKKGDGK